MRDDNYTTDPDQVYQQYSGLPSTVTFGPLPSPGSTAISLINGVTGPTINFDGGTSGFSFSPAGTTVTLAGPLTTKGDLYVRNATQGTRLAVAANDARLTTDSAEATGLKWIAASTGWGAPSGTLSRAAYAAYAGQTVSNPPTQAEMQALDDAVKLLSQVVAAMLTDLRAQKIIKT